ncbi:MAG TPA: class I adenylate-forming enzyme family protein [Steroidobacteraceae bacterium]|nr:class I adenylate-forming enzyme family protein [Steroidobacteraceae bacterium]HNS28593.1 class I adenylate-forming enzyme family protein [Steroidobacteraceae bacterium]
MPAGPTSLVDLLRASAQRHPGRQAIRHRGAEIHYGDLWREVRRAANALRAGGLQPGDRVALLIENSIDYVIAYYAALQAGGVAVGLNTAMRGPELARNVAHCAATALIAMPGHPELPGVIAACGTLRQVVTTPATGPARKAPDGAVAWHEWMAAADDADVPETIEPQAPASIIYTSGTTGDPRGVTLSHRNLVANTLSILEYLGLTEADRIVNVLPFYYSYGNSVLHTHLAAGGSLVLENSLTYPHLVVQAMAEQRATGFSGVPSTFALLLQRVKFADYDLSSLRYLTQAGGAMAPVLTERLLAALPGARLFVMYGQTEATARISYLPPERLASKLGTVGIGIPGVTIEVQDEAGRAVPAGTAGEVCVRGDNVMLGYWENPAATAKVLHDGWLHTGDIGQLDADGYLTLVGRSSDMIKTGAHRVSPLEIEEVVLELAGVAECAAVGVADPILGEVVRVCVVAADGAAPEARAVQAHCRDRLAAYKVPKEVVFVATLPKTASGKVKRFMLKEAG